MSSGVGQSSRVTHCICAQNEDYQPGALAMTEARGSTDFVLEPSLLKDPRALCDVFRDLFPMLHSLRASRDNRTGCAYRGLPKAHGYEAEVWVHGDVDQV